MKDGLKGLENPPCQCGHQHERIGYKNGNFVYNVCKISVMQKPENGRGPLKDKQGRIVLTRCRCSEGRPMETPV